MDQGRKRSSAREPLSSRRKSGASIHTHDLPTRCGLRVVERLPGTTSHETTLGRPLKRLASQRGVAWRGVRGEGKKDQRQDKKNNV